MKLHDRETNEKFEAEIIQVEPEEFIEITKMGRFDFDWAAEQENYVLKIIEANNPEKDAIHGLISLIDYPEEFRIHINLIENANQNKGKKKKVDFVAGCLLAFAAQLAFERGYYGFTSLVPKTELIELYMRKYGFSQFGRQLAIEGKDAIQLIEKYLK